MSIFSKGSSQWVPRYNGIQIQSSSSAIPIPIVYGTNRIAPNILWTGGFRSYAQKSGGGKGGGQVTGYDYQTDMVIGLCEGPIWSYGTVWNGNEIVPMNGNGLYFGTAYVGTTYGDGYTVYSGAGPSDLHFAQGGLRNDNIWANQGPFGSQGLYYPGLAYLCSSDVDLGTSGTMPSLAFELYGRLQGTAGVPPEGMPEYGIQDADPARCIYDFLTNAQYGVGFPTESIDMSSLGSDGLPGGTFNASSYQTYCFAIGFRVSPCLVDQEAANSILARWLQLTNSTAVWSGGLLKFIPYGDTQARGYNNSETKVNYTPNTTPVVKLGPNEFVVDGDTDPVICIRSNPYTAHNMLSVVALDRAYYYSPTTIAAFDQNAIDAYGLRIGSSITANEICALDVAQKSAQLLLQRGLYIRNTYQFKLSFEYCLLDPMDVVTLTEPLIGLDNTPVRIVSIEEDDAGLLSFTAEEFTEGVASVTCYNVQGNAAIIKSIRYAVPSPVNPPIIFEPPAGVTGGSAEVWAAVSAGIPPMNFLTEDSSTGNHSITWHGLPGTAGETVTFQVQIVPGTRSAVSLTVSDGLQTSQCDFLLIDSGSLQAAPGNLFTRTTISTSTVTPTTGDPVTFYVLSVELKINSGTLGSFTPTLMLSLSNTMALPNTLSYAGIPGDGVQYWTPQSSTGGDPVGFITTAPLTAGVTTTVQTALTPLGLPEGADPNWGGCYVWSSTDGTNYSRIGQITQTSRQGALTALLPAFSGSNPDPADTCSVELTQSGSALASGTESDAANAVTLCIAANQTNFELFSYATASLTSPNNYDLTRLYRGLYGTSASEWPATTPFARLDSNIFTYNLPSGLIGQQLYFKFQSYNIFGNSVQDLSECIEYTYTAAGTGAVGAVASALLLGLDLDYGLTSAAVTESDDWGIAPSSATNTIIDLGTAS